MLKITFPRSIVLSGVIALSALAAACGGGDDDPTATTAPAATATTAPATAPPPTSTPVPPTATTPSGGGDGDAVARGEAQFTSQGCSACHSTGKNTIIGPGLSGVGQRNNAAYIRQSIKEPNAVIAEGFDPLMPTFPALGDDGVEDLVAYLMTLN